MKKVFVAGAAVALLVSSCAVTEDSNLQDSVPESTQATGALPVDPNASGGNDASEVILGEPGDTPPPADDSGSLILSDDMPPAVPIAVADLATHLGVSVDEVDWVSYVEVDWSDGSLGCPQPGVSYTQAIVSGSLTTLEVDGVAYAYHADADGDPFRCALDASGAASGKPGGGPNRVPPTTTP